MIARGKSVRGGDHQVISSRLDAHFKYIERLPCGPAYKQRDACRLFSKDQDTVLGSALTATVTATGFSSAVCCGFSWRRVLSWLIASACRHGMVCE
jgi:hypothetical protein